MSQPPVIEPVRYVMLDSGLERADPRTFERLLGAFAAGYAETFHGDEAEPSARWSARIRGEPPPQPLLRIALAVQGRDGAEQVIGGAAVEYYRASASVLCTYLYVVDRPEHRHRGHARALLAAATRSLATTGPLRAVLAEVEWPDELPRAHFPASAIAAAATRLRFFERIGARRIAVNYVQPALGPNQRPVPWLRLMLLPAPPGTVGPQDASALRTTLDAFLCEFHEALAADCGRPVDAAALAAQRAQVAAAEPLLVGLGR